MTMRPTGFVIKGPPPVVGYWWVKHASFKITTSEKPRWLTRIMTKFLLQWEWKDGAP